MWHIVAIGYLFVAVMFSAAQPSIARALIYLVSDGLLSAIIRQFSISETLFYFLKLMPTFAEGCLTIGAAYQVLCD